MKEKTSLNRLGEYADVDVGVVTGLNEYFVLTKQNIEKHSLKGYGRPIVTRSGHLEGARFSLSDWQSLHDNELGSVLFNPPENSIEGLPAPVKSYVLKGESEGKNKGYKCRIRKLWYVVPSVWIPDAFMLRQVHRYPKLILNETEATCTDTIHRVKLLNGTKGSVIAAAFLNSLTFAFSEIMGRSYGGGVLTFEPSEVEELPLPLNGADNIDFEQVDTLLRQNEIEKILDMNDEILLKQGLGLTDNEIVMLRNIWHKLSDRRIHRKYSRA